MPSTNTDHLLQSPHGRAWPDEGCSRVPNWVYTDPEIFARETERVFGANDWLYTCLEAEIPNTGDFTRSQLGTREVVAVRGPNGDVTVPVSYTHLDVYKRQVCGSAPRPVRAAVRTHPASRPSVRRADPGSAGAA